MKRIGKLSLRLKNFVEHPIVGVGFELFSESQQGQLARQEMAKRSEGQKGTALTVIIDGAQWIPKD